MESRTEDQQVHGLGFKKNVVIENVAFDTYRRAPGMNASGIKDILRSPEHFYERRYNQIEEEPSPAMRLGKLVHYAVLEPLLFKKLVVIEPEFIGYTKKGEPTKSKNSSDVKQQYENWKLTLSPDAMIVTELEQTKILGMVSKLLVHPMAGQLLRTGVGESTIFWDDEETGELCKARPDFITSDGIMIDLKTTSDARDDFFGRSAGKLMYNVQAAHYLEAAKATGQARKDSFIFMAIESEAPHGVAIYPMGPFSLESGRSKRSKAMKLYSECKKTNHWPGYNPEAKTLEIPIWYMDQTEENY